MLVEVSMATKIGELFKLNWIINNATNEHELFLLVLIRASVAINFFYELTNNLHGIKTEITHRGFGMYIN